MLPPRYCTSCLFGPLNNRQSGESRISQHVRVHKDQHDTTSYSKGPHQTRNPQIAPSRPLVSPSLLCSLVPPPHPSSYTQHEVPALRLPHARRVESRTRRPRLGRPRPL